MPIEGKEEIKYCKKVTIKVLFNFLRMKKSQISPPHKSKERAKF